MLQLDFILKVALRDKASPDVIPSPRVNIDVGVPLVSMACRL